MSDQPSQERELSAEAVRTILDAARRLPANSTWDRLVADLLHPTRRAHSAARSEPIRPSRYRRGTPLHWESTPPAEN